MSVTFATEPAGSRSALADGLNALGASPLPSAKAHFAAVNGASAPPPLPVHVFGLDELAAGRDPRNGLPTSWKYLLVCGSQSVRSADVLAFPNGFEFASISETEASAINNAVEAAENDQVVSRGDYELRLARIPALYVTALWLKDVKQGQDRFVVVPPAPEGFAALSIHDGVDFLKLLQAAAKKRATPQQAGSSPTN